MKPQTTAPITVVCLALGVMTFFGPNTETAQAQQVQVNFADPAAAAQATVNLDVKVTGKGFKNGAKAKFLVTGTADPGGVQVNSTTFVSSTELRANIDVAEAAVIANFDIEVSNSDGRGGKGTELFKVTAKGTGSGNSTDLALDVTIEPLDGNCNICPDNPATPTYANGLDSVNAVFGTYGHFVFFSGTRAVKFLYSTPLGDSLTTKTLPPSEAPTDVRARTFNTSEPYTNLQDMFVGQQQCLGLGWIIGQNTDSQHGSGFRYGRGDLTNTSFVVVTRNDSNTWTMEPGPQSLCDSTFFEDNVARVRSSLTVKGKTSDYDYGRYVMTFKMILTRQ